MVEDGERMCVQFDENTDEIVVHFFTVLLTRKTCPTLSNLIL